MLLTNKYNLPQSFIDVVNSLVYDISESDPKRISATTLITAPRQRLLSVRHWNELEEDVSDHIWRITGNAYHYILSRTETQHKLVEEKIEHIVDDITVVSKLDSYDDLTKGIEDWKITSVYSFRLGSKIEWEQQLNIYAWALRKFGLVVNNIHINAILRDWSKSESLRYKDYPPIAFQRVEIKLWSFEEQQKFVEERVKLYKSVLELSDNQLPLCTDKERWKKEDSYAVYKNNNKTASRVLDTLEEANKYILENGKEKDKYRVEKRPGIDSKCVDYCICNSFCKYYKDNYEKPMSKEK